MLHRVFLLLSPYVSKCLALVCLVCLVCLPSLQAIAQDHIVARAWFEDRTASQTIETIRDQEFRDFRSVLSRGYGDAPIWVRLTVDPTVSVDTTAIGDASSRALFLRVRPAYLDSLLVYDPLEDGPEPKAIGDREALSRGDEPSSTFVVALRAGSEPRDIYVRLQSTSTRLAHFEVLPSFELRRDGSRLDHLGAFYLTVIGVFLVWGLIQLANKPNVLLLTFVVYQAATILFSFGMLGYARLYLSGWLSPPWIDYMTSVPAVAATGAVMFFCIQMLREISDHAWYATAEKMILIVYPVILVVMSLGMVRPVLQFNMIAVLVIPIAVLVLAIRARPIRTIAELAEPPEARLPRPVVIGFFAVSCFFTLMTALPALGLLEGAEISLYIVLFYALTSGCLMVGVLYYRGVITLRRQTALAAEAGEQRLKAQQERNNRLERERLLAMLGHELKTPLATMRMLLMDRQIPERAADRLQASVTDMAHVVERTVQTSQVEDDAIEVRLEGCELYALVEEVLKSMQDGHRISLVRDADDPATLRTQTDAYLVQVILRNLFDNALKYGAADGTVVVVIDPVNAAHRWSVTVSNRPGQAGWPDRLKVFEKYYRSPAASHRSGSGLGLYMIQGIAKTLGGRLVYEPDAHWVRFRLELPHTPERPA